MCSQLAHRPYPIPVVLVHKALVRLRLGVRGHPELVPARLVRQARETQAAREQNAQEERAD